MADATVTTNPNQTSNGTLDGILSNIRQETSFAESYKRVLPELMAIPAEEVKLVNLDVAVMTSTVFGALPEILALLPQFAEEQPKLDLKPIRNLEAYAMALSHAHTLHMMASQPLDSLQPLMDAGVKLRDMLVQDATVLANRGLLSGGPLAELKGPVGFRNVATDLQVLATLFSENMPALQGKCATQPDEVKRAEQIAQGLLWGIGLREQGTAQIAETTDIRNRAFTMLLRAYHIARGAVTSARWQHQDMDDIAPSLYAGRATRKKAETPATTPSPVPPAGGGGTVPTVPGQPVTVGSSKPEDAGRPGTPNANPFVT
ncbi:MAG TPA: hypothetical protein VG937_04480 [Polyangiaceae bacterium]|nr:hypothetical protein [Polyangiaceae bacterium]